MLQLYGMIQLQRTFFHTSGFSGEFEFFSHEFESVEADKPLRLRQFAVELLLRVQPFEFGIVRETHCVDLVEG